MLGTRVKTTSAGPRYCENEALIYYWYLIKLDMNIFDTSNMNYVSVMYIFVPE